MRTAAAEQCRRRFLRFFPGGFQDPTYLEWERNYKAEAARRWQAALGRRHLTALLDEGRFGEVARLALGIESRTNLLFSFEKMALRDATRGEPGARDFGLGLFDFLHGEGKTEMRFARWVATVAKLPRRQTRVLTWPVVTVFGFLAQPHRHIFLKPNVTRIAASRYGIDWKYVSRPAWPTYRDLLAIADLVRHDLHDLQPRDLIDIQSFLWVQGSEEYKGRTFRSAQTTRLSA